MHTSRSLPPAGPGAPSFSSCLFGSASCLCPPALQRGCATPEHAAIRTVAGIKGGVVRQRYGRRQGKMPCLHAPKSVWRHSVREFHGQKPNACLSFLQYRACERRYRCCYLPISYLPLRRMPSNDSAWCTLLHITGCIQSISLHGRWSSRCSVPCACPCTYTAPPCL